MNNQVRSEACQGAATPIVGVGGEGGGLLIDDADPHTGEFKAIYVKEDCEFATVAGNIEGLNGTTWTKGEWIHGLFTSIELASGEVLAYRS